MFSSQNVNIFTLLYFLIKNLYFFIKVIAYTIDYGIIKTVKKEGTKLWKD